MKSQAGGTGRTLPGGTVTEARDIRDVRPPVPFPIAWGIWAAVAAAALVLLAAWFVRRRLRGRAARRAKADPPPPPWETARARLEDLRMRDLPSQGRIDAFFTELSSIVRHYIEDRFALRAPEMTTEEFLWSLGREGALDADQRVMLEGFLTACDRVKFARHAATRAEIDDAFALADRFVRETTPPSEAGEDEGTAAEAGRGR